MSIRQIIGKFHNKMIEGKGHHRYRSWEHCYGFFRQIPPAELVARRDLAAMQLGFYLASWGMYRPSGFLLDYAYTAHLGVIDCLARPEFLPLWKTEFGGEENDSRLIPTMVLAIQAVKEAYKEFGQATDTLATKVILGTLGCLPACDRYFISGFRSQDLTYSRPNVPFIKGVRSFCRDNINEIRAEQLRIENRTGVHYPLMKLIDMYFWQIGLDEDNGEDTENAKEPDSIPVRGTDRQ